MKLNQGPTFAQLRERVHKQHYREIGNLLARYIARPSAVYGTWLAIRVGLSANQVTGLALFAAVAGSVGIGTGTRTGFLVGTIFLCFSFWLDRVDGQLARWYKTASLNGVYYDYLMHYVANFARFRPRIWPGQADWRLGLGDRRGNDRFGMVRAEFAQRLPVQGILSGVEASRWPVSRRSRTRRPTLARAKMAAPGQGADHLAALQGVRASRRSHRVNRPVVPLVGLGPALAFRLALERVPHGVRRACSRAGANRSLHFQGVGRGRISPLVPTDRDPSPFRTTAHAKLLERCPPGRRMRNGLRDQVSLL